MNENPIWTKDNMLSDRSLFMPMLISFTNLVLLILFIANLYYISLNGLQTGEIRYAGFLQIYYLVAAGLFLFLLLLAPAITVSSLSTEEEEHMLELLLETDLDSRSIIFGKLFSELSTLGRCFCPPYRFWQPYLFTEVCRIIIYACIFSDTGYPVSF